MFRSNFLFLQRSTPTSRILMKYPTRLETISTITSCTIPNDPYFASYLEGTSSAWSRKLRDFALYTMKSNPSVENIRKIEKILNSQQIQSKLLLQPSSSSMSNNNNNNESISSHHHPISTHQVILLLSLCYQTGTPPTDALLTKTESIVPQLLAASCNGSPQYLMTVIGCYEFFAPHRLPKVLEEARRSVESATQSLRASELAILVCQYANLEISTSSSTKQKNISSSFYETLLERIVMLCNDFSAHEISQISLALSQLAVLSVEGNVALEEKGESTTNESLEIDPSQSPMNKKKSTTKLFSDVQDAIHHDLGQRFVQQQELSTLKDAADMLFAVALCELEEQPRQQSAAATTTSASSSTSTESVSPLTREITEACARRLFLMLRDIDAQTVSKTLCALSKISLRTPRLLADLGEVSTRLDFGNLHPIAALDTMSAAAELGLNNANNNNKLQQEEANHEQGAINAKTINLNSFDSLFGRLTSRMMSGRSEILRNDEAREKLLSLVSMLK